jgi:hypothetical protein
MKKLTQLSATFGPALSLAIGLAFSQASVAAVSEQQAQQLGQQLTPMGAELAANGDASIPAWTGKAADLANDKKLFTIDQSNMAQYQDKLTVGQQAMLNKYPDYKIHVYPTRRTANYPADVLEATRFNATNVSLNENGSGLVGGYQQGTPFPVPQSAEEIIWNHIARYRGGVVERIIHRMAPQTNGSYTPSEIWQKMAFNSHIEDAKSSDNLLYYFVGKTLAPARNAGTMTLVHETMDQIAEPRKAWIYNAGQRRVRRAPQVAYDSPQNNAEGQATSDNMDMYNGAMDRYDWKLVGKKEIYIPYNNQKLHDKSLSYDDIIQPGHINSDLVRHELHRVWQVEGTLRTGMRHVYKKRTFFIDEDTWQIAIADHYDERGELWRVGQAYHMNFDAEDGNQVPWYTAEAVFDLISGRYLINGLSNEVDGEFNFGGNEKKRNFKPSALRRMGGKL